MSDGASYVRDWGLFSDSRKDEPPSRHGMVPSTAAALQDKEEPTDSLDAGDFL